QLVLYPAIVQGEHAKESIVRGIRCLDKLGVDVIIAGRGGGSIEDLWAFNEEAVARAIFECNTPVISAVGHETDYTIADFVADLRAPTPSAAAELAVCDILAVEKQIQDYNMRLNQCMKDKIQGMREQLNGYVRSFRYLNPVNVLNERRMTVHDYEERLNHTILDILKKKKHTLALLSGRLNGVSPLNRIMAGYAYVEDDTGTAVKSIDAVSLHDAVLITLKDGVLKADVTEKEKRMIGGNNGKTGKS
ncbi:MAG: exodeoxyribonuclease VII large subunit, partial [Thermoflexaceae bacterium]|nr:exodeoxyribonuclease VII large subunit [Thermoflexaceae bacterium]